MAEVQNKKKGTAKGKSVKKGSPARRSFFFKPATIILAVLTTLLLVLGILYFARVQHWFAAPTASEMERKTPITGTVLQKGKKEVKPKAAPAEEYHNIPRQQGDDYAPLRPEKGALVAIIVDDLGADLVMMQDFLDLQLNITAAILPNLPHARAVAELAHADGREVILHIPMEPQNYPAIDPGENALLVELSKAEVQQRLRSYLQIVPWVVGANNHMGSRFTESREGMRGVLQILKDQGLFFVDSRTTADSVAIIEAKKNGIAHAGRDVFLDNDINEEDIRRQIRKLVKIAKAEGSAIGICHPHHETVTALKKEAPSFAAAGVTLVAASALVH
ncbi:MAG: divergent polysaccharide deacetylase family protein [Desulfuromonadales bacterium]|nr:divergent polysaccharide deacetylase family protein [Desulfuromonadales bacterium]